MKTPTQKKAPTNKRPKSSKKCITQKVIELADEQKQILAYECWRAREDGAQDVSAATFRSVSDRAASGNPSYQRLALVLKNAGNASKFLNSETEVAFAKLKTEIVTENRILFIAGFMEGSRGTEYVPVAIELITIKGVTRKFELVIDPESRSTVSICLNAREAHEVLSRTMIIARTVCYSTQKGVVLGYHKTDLLESDAGLLKKIAARLCPPRVVPKSFMGLPVLDTADLKRMADEGSVNQPLDPGVLPSSRCANFKPLDPVAAVTAIEAEQNRRTPGIPFLNGTPKPRTGSFNGRIAAHV